MRDSTVVLCCSWRLLAVALMLRRFEAFFKEPVHESAAENFRIRKCVVLYYLEDDSMQVSEPKVENSGIPQGVFIKRHRIPKPDEAYAVRRRH